MADPPQSVIAGRIGGGLGDQLQCRWRLQPGGPFWFLQPAEAVQHMLLGELPCLQGHGHGFLDPVFVVE